MLVKSETKCAQFVANDGCSIRELLHPRNDAIELSFSLAVAEVAPGKRTYRHRLAYAEVYYVIAGSGLMHIDGETRRLEIGDAVLIPANAVQWIDNLGDTILKFAAIVTPPWSATIDTRIE